jgi:hypothetical protein
MRLYEISQALIDLATAYEQGDIPDEAYKDTLQGIEMEFEDKAEQIAKIIRNFEADNMGLQSEIDRLQAMAASNSNQIKHLKNYLFEQMKAVQKDKFATALFKFSICKNGGEPPMQIIGAVPDEYKKLVEDNVKIREALKSGKTLDFAILGERGEHLRIK